MATVEIRKSILLPAWDERVREKIISFWQERGIVFTVTTGDTLTGKRGSFWGNLTSFDMSKLMAELTVSRLESGSIECRLEVNTVLQDITPSNRAYWQLEMDTLESWLLRGDKREAEWTEFRKARKKADVKWALERSLILPIDSVQTSQPQPAPPKPEYVQMLLLNPPIAFARSDGWLLTALWAAKGPVDRQRLNQIGDAFNHAVFNDREVEEGMRRLSAASLAEHTSDGLFKATELGKLFVQTHWVQSAGHIDNMLKVIDALMAESK